MFLDEFLRGFLLQFERTYGGMRLLGRALGDNIFGIFSEFRLVHGGPWGGFSILPRDEVVYTFLHFHHLF